MNDARGSAQNGGSNLTTMQAKSWEAVQLAEAQAPSNRFLLGQ